MSEQEKTCPNASLARFSQEFKKNKHAFILLANSSLHMIVLLKFTVVYLCSIHIQKTNICHFLVYCGHSSPVFFKPQE